MFCIRKCPNCKSKVSFKKILRASVIRQEQDIHCDACNSVIRPNWDKGKGVLILPILFVYVFLFKGELTFMSVMIDIAIALFVFFPAGVLLAGCIVPLKMNKDPSKE